MLNKESLIGKFDFIVVIFHWKMVFVTSTFSSLRTGWRQQGYYVGDVRGKCGGVVEKSSVRRQGRGIFDDIPKISILLMDRFDDQRDGSGCRLFMRFNLF